MEKALKINAMTMAPKEQENLRLLIVRMHKKGKSVSEIAELTNAKMRHIQSTIKKYKDIGIIGIRQKPMGRPKGKSSKLTGKIEKEIRKLITNKTPEQLGFEIMLWDRLSVSELINKKYKIKMPVSTMGYYLQKWGFTAQRPIKRNYKQNPARVQKWLDEDYPKIKKRALKSGGTIFWGDETGVQNESNYIKGYAPKGETPILETDNNKMSINMISAITNQGKLRFMCYEENMNQQKLIIFLKRLVKDSEKKIFLILDNLKVHHGKIISQYIQTNKKNIEIFYLPAYAPELNPDEYLNGNLKRELAKKGHARTATKLRSNTNSIMRKLQSNEQHIKNYFENKYINYASEYARHS